MPRARRCLARPRPFRRGRLGRGRSCAAESHLSHLIPPNPASNLISAGGGRRNRTATLARNSCRPGIRTGVSACGRLTGSHRASPRVPGPAARPRCPFRTAVRRTGRRDRAGHTAAASGLDRRSVSGRSVRDDRLCDLLVAAAGASAGLGHEQRSGRLALGCVLRRLRPRGPFPHRNDRSGRRPPRLHSGRGALRRGFDRHVLPGDGILVRLAVARDRRRRPRRMLHAGPQGAHRPPAPGTAGARSRLLHGLLQHRHCGLLRARGRCAGVVRVARRFPVRGRRTGPQRRRRRDAGGTAGAGGGHRGAQTRAGLPPGPALAGDDGLHRCLCRPRGRAVRHALLDRAVPRLLPGQRRRPRTQRHALRHHDLAHRSGFEYRRRGAGIARRTRAPDHVGDAGDVRAQRPDRLFFAAALRRGGVPLPGLCGRHPGRFGGADRGSRRLVPGGSSRRNACGAFDTGVRRIAVRAGAGGRGSRPCRAAGRGDRLGVRVPRDGIDGVAGLRLLHGAASASGLRAAAR